MGNPFFFVPSKKKELTWKSLCKVKRRTMKVVNDFEVTAIKVSGMYSWRDCWQCPKEILSSGSSITWPSFSIFNSSNKVKISWAFITEIMRSHFPVSTLRLVHLGYPDLFIPGNTPVVSWNTVNSILCHMDTDEENPTNCLGGGGGERDTN